MQRTRSPRRAATIPVHAEAAKNTRSAAALKLPEVRRFRRRTEKRCPLWFRADRRSPGITLGDEFLSVKLNAGFPAFPRNSKRAGNAAESRPGVGDIA